MCVWARKHKPVQVHETIRTRGRREGSRALLLSSLPLVVAAEVAPNLHKCKLFSTLWTRPHLVAHVKHERSPDALSRRLPVRMNVPSQLLKAFHIAYDT